MKSSVRIAAAVLIAISAPLLRAGTVYLNPVADTTLLQAAANNNLGGQTFANSGTTQNYTRNRALFRFDLQAAIPPGSKIISAALILEVTRIPDDGFAASTFELHRVLKPWGEGNKTGTEQFPGLGQPATEGEATWNHRFAGTTNTWSIPGGALIEDFSSTISCAVDVYDVHQSPYILGSTLALVADVQMWLNAPETNFGWILLSNNETANFTARRFGSREAGIDAPRLEIEFLAAPEIQNVQRTGDAIHFTFIAEPELPYSVERKAALDPAQQWETVTNIPPQIEATTISITNVLGAASTFYRVIIP